MLLVPPDMNDFDYVLPVERIASQPADPRDSSRLLVGKDGNVYDAHFADLATFLPAGSLLMWNNTRVIHARLLFHKPSGARVEIFCLEPLMPEREIQRALQAGPGCVWQCLVGNARKWKGGILEMEVQMESGICTLQAEQMGQEGGTFQIRFSWTLKNRCLAEVLEAAGKVPLPPYIPREATERDNITYQTVYAQHDGSVAAPTAGLHFTDRVIGSLEEKSIRHANVTLHVGAGTFKPVSEADLRRHVMHTEQIHLRREDLNQLMEAATSVVAVGTTSLRTLESFYWMGVKILSGQDVSMPFALNQWDCYEAGWPQDIPASAAWRALRDYMEQHNRDEVSGETRLFILPGYKVRTADILITNFHQPRSTLLLLVSAFTGNDWRKAYDHALATDYRFLSYGDACLFFRKTTR